MSEERECRIKKRLLWAAGVLAVDLQWFCFTFIFMLQFKFVVKQPQRRRARPWQEGLQRIAVKW